MARWGTCFSPDFACACDTGTQCYTSGTFPRARGVAQPSDHDHTARLTYGHELPAPVCGILQRHRDRSRDITIRPASDIIRHPYATTARSSDPCHTPCLRDPAGSDPEVLHAGSVNMLTPDHLDPKRLALIGPCRADEAMAHLVATAGRASAPPLRPRARTCSDVVEWASGPSQRAASW